MYYKTTFTLSNDIVVFCSRTIEEAHAYEKRLKEKPLKKTRRKIEMAVGYRDVIVKF